MSVSARVGATVYQGQVLASLDTSALAAQRASAQAQLSAAEANLAQMLAGARAEDVAAKQTAIDQANTTLINLYGSSETSVLSAYDKVLGGFSQNTDNLFNQAQSSNPSLAFSTSDNQLAILAVTNRVQAQSELAAWQNETSTLSPSTRPSEIEAALSGSLAHLFVLRTYSDSLISALASATASNTFGQAAINTAQISVGAYQSNINALIATLQGQSQQIASQKLAVQSAKNALDQVKAGSTQNQVAAQRASVAAAQAQVQNINAQINNELLVAPFSGTVASVQIKSGDTVAANAPAISLNPESALQIEAYFSEIDITKVHVGASAEATLDAYGDARIFPTTVVSVDSAPSQNAGGTGYKATFQFQKSDPAISSGMTANITIPLTQ